jgi:hypothetical protein
MSNTKSSTIISSVNYISGHLSQIAQCLCYSVPSHPRILRCINFVCYDHVRNTQFVSKWCEKYVVFFRFHVLYLLGLGGGASHYTARHDKNQRAFTSTVS